MKFIETVLRFPWWAKAAACLTLVLYLAGLLSSLWLSSFFESPVGSFVASILAGLGGILLGSILATYIVTLYWEKVRLSNLVQQRIPYLRDIKRTLKLSVAALCLELKCPFLDQEMLGNPQYALSVIEGREKEIRDWFGGIENGGALESPNVAGILICLNHIATLYLQSPRERLLALSHLYEDRPSIRDDFFNVVHNIDQARAYFSHPYFSTKKVDLPPAGQKMLGDIGRQLIDILTQVTDALADE